MYKVAQAASKSSWVVWVVVEVFPKDPWGKVPENFQNRFDRIYEITFLGLSLSLKFISKVEN